MTVVLAPLRLDARVWFANERTFLSWMGISSILTTFAGGLNVINEGSVMQTASVLLLTAASLIFVVYATHMHYHRARQLRRRRVSAYEDRRGATLLFVVMTVAVRRSTSGLKAGDVPHQRRNRNSLVQDTRWSARARRTELGRHNL